MAVVTISRLKGSEGDEIALKVSRGLGYDLVDTNLIVEIANRAGVSIEDVRNIDEKYQSRAVKLLKGFITPRMSKVLAGQECKHLDPKSYLEFLKTIILGLAEKGNMVIVGRAGQFILKDEYVAYHVRIVADDTFRIERIKERNEISESDAYEMIKKSDSMRKNYIEKYLNEDWASPLAYHLVVNSSQNGIDETAHIIVEAVKKFSATHEYIPGVRDRRKNPRRFEEDRRTGDRRAGEELWSQNQTKRSIMKGRPVRTHIKPDRRHEGRRRKDRRAGIE